MSHLPSWPERLPGEPDSHPWPPWGWVEPLCLRWVPTACRPRQLHPLCWVALDTPWRKPWSWQESAVWKDLCLWANVGLNVPSTCVARGPNLLGCHQAAGPPGSVTQCPASYQCRRDQIVWKEFTSVLIAALNYEWPQSQSCSLRSLFRPVLKKQSAAFRKYDFREQKGKRALWKFS